MVKKLFLIVVFLCAISVLSYGTWTRTFTFLTTPVNCAISTTLVNGTNFVSRHISVRAPTDMHVAAVTVMFTRAAGTTATVDFEFQATNDMGANWSTAYYVRIQVPTNETASGTLVKVTKLVYVFGISHLRLYRIVNNDAANAITNCNVTLGM